MTKVALTGGGTAGHVIGNLAILPGLRQRGYELVYIGSHQGIERDLITRAGLPYRAISSGKLRRYRSWKNLTDVVRVGRGLVDALSVLRREKPDLIFSKGGFVTVPVAAAAALLGIPFIGHESDLTPGLANRLASRWATRMLVTFPETRAWFGDKGTVVGSPVRAELFQGTRQAGLDYLGFTPDRPVLLVMGGSLGARFLNETVWDHLSRLTQAYQVVHLVGRGNVRAELSGIPGYLQREFIGDEMKDVLQATDLVISRSGSNSIFEFLALTIPNLLIPLDLNQSRGDQIENAESFKKAGYSLVLREAELTPETFFARLEELERRAPEFRAAMAGAAVRGALERILAIIDETVAKPGRPCAPVQPETPEPPVFHKNITQE